MDSINTKLTVDDSDQIKIERESTTGYLPGSTIVSVFEAQVKRRPEAAALTFENYLSGQLVELTYRELNASANQVANYLRRLGVGVENLVGLFIERSIEMAAALLGILKAGAAYAPFDTTYPGESITFMINDTDTRIILTQEKLINKLPPNSAQVICLDRDWPLIALESSENLPSTVTSENMAYVMYTSGSTGSPKGVSVVHRGVVRLVKGVNYASFSKNDVFLQLAPISFDASTLEIWGALLNGARLVIMPPSIPSLQCLQEVITKHHVTTLWLTAGLFHLAVEERPDIFKPLSQLLAGGDVLSVPHVEKILSLYPSCTVINGYGPTENTTFTCCHKMQGKSDIGTSVPIGRAVTNTEVFILDNELNPVPEGEVGELYIGGSGLARGYWGHPDLTAERFVPSLFGSTKGMRLYRSGDLVRSLSDGTIAFVGRTDNQVKIRGFRVEPQEIDAVLGRHPDVSQCVVVVKQNPNHGDKCLFAYVVLKQPLMNPSNLLLEFLKEKLPNYMIPSSIVVLDAMPLNPNGKVNKNALPALDSQTPAAKSPYVPVSSEDELDSLKDELLNLLLEEEGVMENEEIPALKTKRPAELPLSFGQQRLWFLYTWDPENPVYNMPAAFKLNGTLSIPALQKSLDEIVRRHESLRTSFLETPEGPVQVAAPPCSAPMAVLDLEHLPYHEALNQAESLAVEEARKPFDIEKDLLIRVTLIKLPDEFELLVTMHHIAADAWSVEVLIHELTALYTAFVNEEPSPLPDLTMQYADYALWQREWFTEQTQQKQLAYWKGYLKNAPVLELPTDYPRPSTMRFQGRTERFVIDESLTKALSDLSRKEGVSLYMTLLSAFLVLLYRYTSQTDIVIGTPVANRNRSEHEQLIGFFVNTLALRTNLAGNPSFKVLLKRVKQVALNAFSHQDMPFEQLVDALDLQRSLSHTPLFQVVFTFQAIGISELSLPGLTIKPMDIDNNTSKFDLTMALLDEGQGLMGELEYNSDLFDRDSITSMIKHFFLLLEGIISKPEESVLTLPLLTEDEKHKLLNEWSKASVDYPRDTTIVELFEEQAAKGPGRIALTFPKVFSDKKDELTYEELNARANQLAHYLIRLGAGNEHQVCLFIERSLEMVIGLLGILKAGAAYVPVETTYPEERIAYMIEDSRASIVLTEEKLLEKLPPVSGKIVCLDRDWPEISRESTGNPPAKATAENLAYITYTSGSTGQPKGVSVVNRGVVRLVRGANYVNLSENETLLQFVPISFDVSTFEIWAALLNGARLVIMPPNKPTLQELEDIITNQQVTILWLSSGMFHLAAEERPETFRTVRQLLAGGDIVSAVHAEKILSLYPECTVINGYGPTENTTFTCCCKAQGRTEIGAAFPIGVPVSNTEVYVLDEAIQPVPVGVVGELYTGGDGLARGYWNRPDLTAERFIPNPFSSRKGDRLYRTGDLVRYRRDGALIFLGRTDLQVKIRGFRIELGEIEAALRQHPAVTNAAAAARKTGNLEKQLAAYLVKEGHEEPEPTELERFLRQKLPDYMIPSVFVYLDTMPLSPNGKLDRRALPEPQTFTVENNYTAPHSSTEQAIVRLMEEVLNRKPVGVEDNFFDLGGHSLLATRVVSRINDEFQLRLSPRVLFENPTASALVQYLEKLQHTLKTFEPPVGEVSAFGEEEEEGEI